MRKTLLVKLLFIVTLFFIQNAWANSPLDPIHNSDYYKDFRKNESPKGIVFKELVASIRFYQKILMITPFIKKTAKGTDIILKYWFILLLKCQLQPLLLRKTRKLVKKQL
jgi:hypothetical protein